MARLLPLPNMELEQIDEGDQMKFSLNTQGNDTSSTANNGIKSLMNEETEMKNTNNNIQMNHSGSSSSSVVIKNTLKMAAGLALAGMIAVTATFGSVSADSPSKATSFTAHGPNEMDIDYLSKLGSFLPHGPNGMDVDYLSKLGNTYLVHGPDVVEPSSASARQLYGPDVVDLNAAPFSRTASVYQPFGPDVAETNNASASRDLIYGSDTSQWNG